LANFYNYMPSHKANFGRSGVEVLTSIMQHCNPETQENILAGLKDSIPEIAMQIRENIVLFEDLAYADAGGIQKLIKMISLKDLAIAAYGSSELLVKNFAQNLSQNRLQDLKLEIRQVGKVSKRESLEARARIMSIVSELMASKNLFIIRSSNNYFI
jgi:flagellar motor switch protein FliG